MKYTLTREKYYMTEDQQKIAYVDLLETARKTEDEIASVRTTLKTMGERFAALGKSLQQNPESISFDRQSFEADARKLGDLIEQCRTAVMKRAEQESQLRGYSYHRK